MIGGGHIQSQRARLCGRRVGPAGGAAEARHQSLGMGEARTVRVDQEAT